MNDTRTSKVQVPILKKPASTPGTVRNKRINEEAHEDVYHDVANDCHSFTDCSRDNSCCNSCKGPLKVEQRIVTAFNEEVLVATTKLLRNVVRAKFERSAKGCSPSEAPPGNSNYAGIQHRLLDIYVGRLIDRETVTCYLTKDGLGVLDSYATSF